MNARFKSLANIWANRRQVEDRLGVVYVFTEEALQVYSEKIVKECATIARDTNLEDIEGGDSSVLGAARDQVLEHFGIKE